MSNILVGQSGGPTAVMNASLYGIINEAQKNRNTVYGMINGIEGFLEGRIINLSECSKNIDIELLKTTPASFLGSCRYKLSEDLDSSVYSELFQKFDDLDIDAFLYIGGNDSMDTVDKLSRYAKRINSDICFIGVPKTIDNDLVMTDHTPGFGSTAKYVASTVRNIIWDVGVYAHPVVTIVELMGRNAGWVTAFGRLICEYNSTNITDQFGHKLLTGCGKVLEHQVKEKIGCKCRSIEINISQRCAGMLASAADIEEAQQAGRFALRSAVSGATGKMVSFTRTDNPYHISYDVVNVSDVCNKEKKFPKEWIVNGNDISPEFREYVYPLIQGENVVEFEGGLPKLLQPAYLMQ